MLLPCLHEELVEAGCDEAGRGALAGPVFAAAVILPKGFAHPMLDDSKKLTAKQREKLRRIIEQEALAWAVASLSAAEIDRLNILRASITAMHNAISQLSTTPSFLLIDGNRFCKYGNIPHQCIVKGDGKYAPIAAASILAKTHRDEYMKRIAAEYPQYGWDKNMAYPTAAHREAIRKFGTTPYHRMSYTLLRDDPSLF
ncbi:MAG: ribonuclease HII [Bacteroidetes bacterium]|uniref:Ribonuclease HII n=1 Tax=Candidatus Egerieousia excrementavium TaxID=2840778 RepID=A0A9D9DKP1_9BACT|nr:ribonuclease HII [Candidatus Egerieousia excrementavium]